MLAWELLTGGTLPQRWDLVSSGHLANALGMDSPLVRGPFQPASGGHSCASQPCPLDPSPLSAGLNLTEKIKKIKIIFTPTICKQTCAYGHCANSCERGDTTTLYSQGGHGHDPKSGFRICESLLPSDDSSWLALSPRLLGG